MIPEGVGGFLETCAGSLLGWGIIGRFVYHLLTLYPEVSHWQAVASVLPPPALPDPSLLWGLSRPLHHRGWGWGAPCPVSSKVIGSPCNISGLSLVHAGLMMEGRIGREQMETSVHLKSSAYKQGHNPRAKVSYTAKSNTTEV